MDKPTGPTLNPEYNQVLAKWRSEGFPSEPECEDCGKSLIGENVHDIGHMWVCDTCYDLPAEPLVDVDEREDFHADDGSSSDDD